MVFVVRIVATLWALWSGWAEFSNPVHSAGPRALGVIMALVVIAAIWL
jgi:hypothetical protein